MPRHAPGFVSATSSTPGSMTVHIDAFLQWLEDRNYSIYTLRGRRSLLRFFNQWCEERGLTYPHEITRPILERYQRSLFLYRQDNGKALSAKSQNARVTAVRCWFKWMTKTGRLPSNPASDLDLLRVEHRLPKAILSVDEAERIMRVPDVESAIGLRDRAILETLYSTGMRRMEVVGLHQIDLDAERGTVTVRQGKGKKDRMIPIGERALAWIHAYCEHARPQLAFGDDDGTLFLTYRGEAMTAGHLTRLVHETIEQADIGKPGSCHLFRHTMATLMLENGADIRFIQAMLGHVDISTTQIYAQVSIVKLKQIHTLTHPARLERVSASPAVDGAQDSDDDPAAALMAMLAVEAREEGQE